ncbi:2-iminobutanoate/2-iminopropanoate deaminase [Bradyrhizobium diazoefficiens]|uniref:RidA family protein n=1 Tax=Bradyrhizobium diazoefficiens TaxID=1355477 RepID=UPI0035198548
MAARRSIEVEGFAHGGQPIPAACRVGNIIMTGGVYGLDPASGKIPDDVGRQTELMFANLKRIMEAGGASLDQIVKMTVYVKVPEARGAVNTQWLAAFPDAASRPARHTFQNDHLPANMLVQCDATAVLDGT